MAATTLFLLLVASLARDCLVAGDHTQPRFRLGNGTLLEDDAVVLVKRGTSLEVYCSGKAFYLEIEMFGGVRQFTTFVNKTAVKFSNEYSQCGSESYTCKDTKTNLRTFLIVFIETLPVVSNFTCIIERVDYMFCDWQTENQEVLNAALFFVDGGLPVRWCKWQYLDTTSPIRCIWDKVSSQVELELSHLKKLTFLMKACVRLGCSEQTFHIKPSTMMKTPKPSLQVRDITSHSVMLRSRIPRSYMYLYRNLTTFNPIPNTLDCKITCLEAGLRQFRLNHTADFYVFFNMISFESVIQLPCPDTFYEVKVSVKLSTSVGEEYWSDEAEVSFITKPAPEGPGATVPDPRCANQNYKITSDVMLADLNRFRRRMKGELKALRERVQALRLKADQDEQTKGFEEIVGPEDFQD